jgi:hypothetical protein
VKLPLERFEVDRMGPSDIAFYRTWHILRISTAQGVVQLFQGSRGHVDHSAGYSDTTTHAIPATHKRRTSQTGKPRQKKPGLQPMKMLKFTTKTTQSILAPLVEAVTTLASTTNVQVSNLATYAQQIQTSVIMCAQAGLSMQRNSGTKLTEYRVPQRDFELFKQTCLDGTSREFGLNLVSSEGG